MKLNIFESLETKLEQKIYDKVLQDFKKEIKKYNVNLTSKGELIIQDKWGEIVKSDELYSDFSFRVRIEKNKMVKNILKKLGYPLEEE